MKFSHRHALHVDTLSILIAVLQHRDRERLILISLDQYGARIRRARVALSGGTGFQNSRWSSGDPLRRAQAQVGIGGDLLRALARPLRQASLGQRLQAPGHTPEQVMLVIGMTRLPEQFAIL